MKFAWLLPMVAMGMSLKDGAALFTGRKPLAGRLEGHSQAMPASATACSHCHNGRQPLGPSLTGASLKSPVARRGGPASVYSEASFCRVLRTGVDPAFVIVRREMPRYEISDQQCSHLWEYLTNAKK